MRYAKTCLNLKSNSQLLPFCSDTDTRYLNLDENLLLDRDEALVSEWPPPRATNLLVAVMPRPSNGEPRTRVARRPKRPRLADRDEEAGTPDENGNRNGDASQGGDEQ